MTKKNFLFIFIFCLFFIQENLGQQEEPTSSILNEYLSFANESIHGMLIAHRLFENYNQDLNKYVDLPGHQLNFYSNKDLPIDIFEDPDHWFYEISPSQLFKNTLDNHQYLSTDDYLAFNEICIKIRGTTLKSNELRIAIGHAIAGKDLEDKEQLYSIYEMLEEASDAYDVLFAQLINLDSKLEKEERDLFDNFREKKFLKLTETLRSIHLQTWNILQNIKNGKKEEIKKLLKNYQITFETYQKYLLKSEGGFPSSNYKRLRNRILTNMQELSKTSNKYLQGEEVPEEYKLYGPEYYYYNTQAINKFNRYGNGITEAINKVINLLDLPLLHRMESPHYLEIIYPNKVEKQLPIIKSTVDEIQSTPEELANRKIVTSGEKHVIYVDDAEPTLEVFDHLKQDGDIISLNFNGDWIFEELSLERKPRKFILKLNQSGKNFLILHAVNEGSVPPNTIGINYIHKGRRKRHIMQSNLKTSQLVEIRLGDEEGFNE